MKRNGILLLSLGFAVLLSGCEGVLLRGTIPDYKEETYITSSKVKDIVLQDEDVPVEICNSDNGKLYLSYYSADDGNEKYKIKESKGVLAVEKESKRNQGIFIFGDQYSSDSYKKVKLTLFLPNDYNGNLSIQTMDGNIVIEDITLKNLIINTNDGDVFFYDTTVTQSLSCKTKDGEVKGTLCGTESEYAVKTKSKNIDNRTNIKTGSNKSIDIITKDGLIDILFNSKNE